MIQSFKDEFDVSDKKPATPAEAGTMFVKAEENEKFSRERHTYF